MEWATWKPIYLRILRDFDYRAEADLEAAMALADLALEAKVPDYRTIVEIMSERVTICAAAATLENELDTMSDDTTVISAGSTTARLMCAGILPDIIVTDLDGDVKYQISANAEGALMFVHAHGDNIALVKKILPKLHGPIVPTVQCQPFGSVYNFGGFTDGDRSYLIAKHFGAYDIRFIGWDCKNVFPKKGSDHRIKQKKLMWAERIINDH